MKFREAHRTILMCALYLALHFGIQALIRGGAGIQQVYAQEEPGLALAFLIVCGPRCWPVVLAAHLFSSLVVNPIDKAAWISVVMPVVVTAGYAATARIVTRFLGPAPLPKDWPESGVLMLAAVAAPLPWDVLRSVFQMAGWIAAPDGIFSEAVRLGIGGAAGVLTIVPAAVVYVVPWYRGAPRQPAAPAALGRRAETAAQAAALALVFWLVRAEAPLQSLDAFSLCFIPLAWIAVRRGLRGATLAILSINVAVYVTARSGGGYRPIIVDAGTFFLAYAAVGLGMGTAVMFRDRAEKALSESEERLARALEGARLGLWDCDLTSGRVTYNDTWLTMLDYKPEEVNPVMGWWESKVHPEDKARVQALLDDHLAGKTPFYEAEYRLKTRNGSWKWIHARGAVSGHDLQGRPLRISGTHLDLTERKQAEIERDRLLSLIAASTDFVGTADLEGRILYMNPAYRRIVGLPVSGPLPNRRIADNYSAAGAEKTLVEGLPAVLTNGVWAGENAIRAADGREVPVSQLIILHRDDTGRPAFTSTIARDISKQREFEAARLATERKVLQAQKLESLGILAGGIAHDFNNLLTVILGNSSLAKLDLPAGSAAAAKLEQIEAAARRAAKLCDQMLAYAGKGQFALRPIDLSGAIEGTAQLLQVSVGKHCALEFDLRRDLPAVLSDPIQIQQIAVNLVANGSDAIGESEGWVRVSTGSARMSRSYFSGAIHSPNLPEGEYVFLEVADSGCGIAPEVRARLGEPFFTTKFTGRGLGLAAVLGIVQAHGGALRVDSEPGRGSVFRVLLPAAATGPRQASVRPAAAPGDNAETVLVVDDEEAVRFVTGRMLEGSGLQAVLAADGEEALRIFRGRPRDFDVVLLDMTMPGLSGENTFRELRRLNPGLPVVFMSGFNRAEFADRISGETNTDFLAKPFERGALVAKLRAAIACGDGRRPLENTP